jgi:gliding motility-associated protein GldM
MSGGDLPPRQKMIGMMYLVLTALLALNVSKDILDAFILINTSLENTVVNYDEKNKSLYADFTQAKSFDPTKVTPFWNKAQQAKKSSSNIINYIKELQIKLLQETEKISKNEADTLQLKFVNGKDNYDIPTNIMIGQTEDGSKGLARELKNKLTAYKKSMLALFNQEERKKLKIDLKTEDIRTNEGVESWEMGNFYHTPLAATVTILSKIQTDVKKVEYDVVSNLLQSAGKKEFNFDTIVTKVIPTSNYVLLGEEYKSDVFLAAFSTTQNPEILIGKYDSVINDLVSVTDSVPVKNGLGQYVVPTSKEGIFSYEGILRLKTSSGGVENFPFKSEYIVAKPSLVISPDKMNVFYIGPKNPVSISVPGVASENISASISGSGNKIKKIGSGKYEVTLSANSPRSVNVSVNATMPNGSNRNMGNLTFVVKKLPKPYAEVGSISTNRESERPIQLKAHTKVKAKYDQSFAFQGLPLNVVKYKIEVWRGGVLFAEKNRTGATISMADRNFLGGLRRRDVIYFRKIIAKDVSGQRVPLNDVIIEVR